MKKLYVLVLVVAVAFCVVLAGCQTAGVSKYNENILATGESGGAFDFSADDDGNSALKNLQEVWTLKSGGTSSDVFSVVDNSGLKNHLKINTQSAGYASVSQKLYLKTYSYYRVSYTYTSSSMSNYDEDKYYTGLYVGFAENPDFNIKDEFKTEEVKANNNGTEEFYFKTEGKKEFTFTIYVGTEDNPVSTASVILKDIKVERVEKAVAVENGATMGLYTLNTTIFGAPTILNLVYVILGAVGTLIIAYAFYMMRARSLAFESRASAATESGTSAPVGWTEKLSSGKKGLLIAIGVTLLVRLVITLVEAIVAGGGSIQTMYLGYDLDRYAEYGGFLSQYGTQYFLDATKGFPTSYMMPFATYFVTIAGLFGRLIGLIPAATEATVLLTTATVIKLFAVAADVGTVVLIYKAVSKRQGNTSGMIFASLYALLPVAFYASSSLGALDSITIFFVTLAFYFILNKNYLGMAISYFAACMMTTSALLAVPMVLMYTAMVIYQSIKDRTKKWIQPTVAIVGGVVLFFLVSLPFFFFEVQKGNVFAGFKYFIETVQGLNVYTQNAFNFQAMLGNNFNVVTTESMVVTILFIAFIVGILAYAYFKSRNRLTLVMLGSAFTILYWYFCNNMQPNGILIALPLLLIYTALVKDKRLYFLFAMFASMMFINTSYVYMIGGYTETGVTQLTYENPIMYIMGAFYLVLIIAYIIIGYDTVVAKQSSGHLVLRVRYVDYVKSVFINIGIGFRNFFYKLQGIGQAMQKERKEKKALRNADKK